MQKPTIFKDKTLLDPRYMPPLSKIVDRKKEMNMILNRLKPLLDDPLNYSFRCIINGSIGVGKTLIVSRIAEKFKEEANSHDGNIEIVRVSCAYRDEIQVMQLILSQLAKKGYNTYFPSRGVGYGELLMFLQNFLESNRIHLVLILDDIDRFVERGSKTTPLLYSLTRFNDASTYSLLSLVLITVSEQTIAKIRLDPAVRDFLYDIIEFKDYDVASLVEILKVRASEALYPNAFEDDILWMIANISDGKARKAISILNSAAQYAFDSMEAKITPEHVRIVVAEYKERVESFNIFELENLPLHTKIFLLSIVLSLKEDGTVNTPMGRVMKYYKILCEEYGVKPKSRPSLNRDIKTLQLSGFIEADVRNVPSGGRTTYFSVNLISLNKLEKELRSQLE